MGLKMIIGASGTGKSEYLYNLITDEAGKNKDKRYFVIVPDQFTMQTQMDMVLKSPGKGIMNIDVLSFSRLAHRIFEETNASNRLALDDTGKSLILRKIVSDIKDEVPYLAGNLKRTGFVHEVKSSICEFMQYSIGANELKELIEFSENKGALKAKLTDLSVVYERFTSYIKDSYITTEETMDLLAEQLYKSSIIKNSVIAFDGFTGFTPVQMNVLGTLMKLCDTVYMSLTLDPDKTGCNESIQELFSFTAKSYKNIVNLANELKIPTEVNSGFNKNYRFEGKPELEYLERKIFRNNAKDDVYSGEVDRIELMEAKDIKAEAKAVAARIRQLVADGEQYRNIAVVTGNLGDYENHIYREFGKYDIPVYMDKTRAIVLNPIVEFVKSLLEIIRRDFSVDSVCRLLRTGLGGFDIQKVDIFENYIIRVGLKGLKKYQGFAQKKAQIMSDATKILSKEQKNELEVAEQIVDKLLAMVAPLLDNGIRKKSKNTAVIYSESLYECLVACDAYNALKEYEEQFKQDGDYTKEKEYSQIYRLTVELLEQIHELLGNEELMLEEFIDILEAGFEEITVGTIPQSVDKVIVGDIERSRLKQVRYLFFMGLNDSNIPKRSSKASIISDMEREYLAGNNKNLELSPTPHQKMYIQRFYLYSNLVKPSEKIFLSYSCMDNAGKSLRPAYIIPMIRRLFPLLKVQTESGDNKFENIDNVENLKEFICDTIRADGEFGIDETKKMELMAAIDVLLKLDRGYSTLLEIFIENSFYKNTDKKLDGVIAGVLYGETLLASISRMEKYAECAYSYFLQYGLSLKEREECSIDSRDMGTIFHETLKRFGQVLDERGISWIDVEQSEAEAILNTELKNLCQDTSLFDSKANEYIYKRMTRVLYKAVDTAIYQLKAGRYEVKNLEVSFSRNQVLDEINVALSTQEKMQLDGRIDRIDTFEDNDRIFVKVIDYKTGDKDFSLLNFYHGTQLQLVVYLSEAMRDIQRRNKEKEILPGALLYYHVADNTVSLDKDADEAEIKAIIRESLKMKGLINDDQQNVEALTGITSGKSDVVNISYTKKGTFSSSSSVISAQNLKLMQDFADYKLRNLGDDIIAGKINCNPVRENEDRNSCTYCSFKNVCRFEERLEGYSMRRFKTETDEVLMERMKQDMETE